MFDDIHEDCNAFRIECWSEDGMACQIATRQLFEASGQPLLILQMVVDLVTRHLRNEIGGEPGIWEVIQLHFHPDGSMWRVR